MTKRILIGMVLGLITGLIAGKNAFVLGELGKLVIQLIKAAATPLLFLVIMNAILHTEVKLKSGLRMLFVAFFNASIALGIGIAISRFLKPGEHMPAGMLGAAPAAAGAGIQKIDFAKALAGFVPTSFAGPFVENAVIGIVIIAMLLAFALRHVLHKGREREAAARLVAAVDVALEMTETMMKWVIQLVPFAVFGVMAKSVGEYGFEPFKGLAWYLMAGMLGLSLQVLIVYQLWIKFGSKIKLKTFWREAWPTGVYAFGANSSLATLPVTLNTLDRLGVSKEASTLGACVGTNFNNDGILLYEGMAVFFVAQAYGIHLDFGQQVLAAAGCMVAAMGIAGVPEAGFISLSLVLGTLGLPVEMLPLLLTVDWIIARGRSFVNVFSDMIVSIAIDR